MQTVVVILSMLLAVPTLSWGQVRQTEDIGNADNVRLHDYYAGKTSIDDGFGGTWNVEYIEGVPRMPAVYVLRRPSNHSKGRLWGGDVSKRLLLNENSGSLEAGIPQSFYGYLSELKAKNESLKVYLWIDPATGKIKEVGYHIPMDSTGRYIRSSVPPLNYTMYEDILKKTVSFDVSQVKYNRLDTLRGFVFSFWAPFSNVIPADGEPNYLKQ